MPNEQKTHTSSAVKRRYNSKVYASVAVQLPKELVAEFKAKCKDTGISQAQVVKEAIIKFLDK